MLSTSWIFFLTAPSGGHTQMFRALPPALGLNRVMRIAGGRELSYAFNRQNFTSQPGFPRGSISTTPVTDFADHVAAGACG